MNSIRSLAQKSKEASRALLTMSTAAKDEILGAMIYALRQAVPDILVANDADMQAAQEAGLSSAMLDRLRLDGGRIEAMITAINTVRALPDPIGQELKREIRPNGLLLRKLRVPIGVIAVIYESRPNVTCDAAVLCLKASNAVILRGGKEALRSNCAIAQAMQRGGESAGLPAGAVQIVESTDRDAIRELVQLEGLVDLVIPRGGEALIAAISGWAKVPVIRNAKGLCHVFVEQSANIEMALRIAENAKCQRPGVCNAMETLLVQRPIAPTFLPRIIERYRAQGVEVRGCEECCRVDPGLVPATPEDWDTEYLDLIVSIRVVDDLDTALAHIADHGSKHSEAIISSSIEAQKRFLQEVDAAAVYVNASTRFTDGGEFGMGAEIGISTEKLHARGPMGLEELTTYKYMIEGTGQVR